MKILSVRNYKNLKMGGPIRKYVSKVKIYKGLEATNPKLWAKVEEIAHKITKKQLLNFYESTKTIEAPNLSEWTKEELVDVIDEISEKNAKYFVEFYR